MGEPRLHRADAAARRRGMAEDTAYRTGVAPAGIGAREPGLKPIMTTAHGAHGLRRSGRVLTMAALALAATAQPAFPQSYPSQNITFVVAFAAGGIADVVARFIGQKLSERLGNAVVVENRGGAGGNLAAKTLSAAAPDGYTNLSPHSDLAVDGHATTT